jgi:hypothetical protein
MSAIVPDLFTQFALISRYIAHGSVNPGYAVRMVKANQPTDANVRAVDETTTKTDLDAIGLAIGKLGDTAFATGEDVLVCHFGSTIHRGMAGAAGVTQGKPITMGTGGFVDAAAPNAGGSAVVLSPGIALTDGASAEAFPFLIRPVTFNVT